MFEGVGNLLKRRRLEDYQLTFGCHLTDALNDDESGSADPAAHDDTLRQKLEENDQQAKNRLEEVF